MATDSIRPQQASAENHVRVRSRENVAVGVGGVSAVLAGLIIVGENLWDIVVPGTVAEGAGESAVHATWMLLLLFGVIGMYLRQLPAIGRFGDFSALIAVLGIVTVFSGAVIEAVLLPALPADSPLHDEGPAAAVWVFLGGFVAYLLGLLLFAAATWRARVLPRRAAGLLFAGLVFGVVAMALVPGSLLVMGAAIVWLGAATLAPAGGRD